MSKPPSNRLLYFLVAVGVVGPIVLALSAWWFLRGEPAGPLVALAGLFLHRGDEAAVAELRGIGCEQVFVMTFSEMFEAQEWEEYARSGVRDRPMVACADYSGRVPTCEEVATTYARFVPDQEEAVVRVTSRGKSACEGLYAASGAYLGSNAREALLGDPETGEP